MTIIAGLGLLSLTLAAFSPSSMKVSKGSAAVSGVANTATVTFPVKAVHRYIFRDLFHLTFLEETGTILGNMGGVAAVIMVPIGMGVNPVLAVIVGVALGEYGILPGFTAGYAVGFAAPFIERHLPSDLDSVLGALLIAPIVGFIVLLVDPAVNAALAYVGGMIMAATEQSLIPMGLLSGGAIRMVCALPLSSMAPTTMLGPTGLPMGTTVIAYFGSSSINGTIFKILHFEDNSNVAAVMVEPLTQTHIITKHPTPIYYSSFSGGGSLGVTAAFLGTINNTLGAASPIPRLLVSFVFNSPLKVLMALLLAAISGTLVGVVRAIIFKRKYDMEPELSVINSFEEQKHSVGTVR